ncbi:MAG: hypothetical protein L0216_15850 [Planctomycetales bacterium]|nr:hypothetical protein [Planctomycetales bacterium]
MIQALEALKLVVGAGDPLVGRLLLFDSLGMKFREVKLRRDPGCPVCGEKPTIRTVHEGAVAFACSATGAHPPAGAPSPAGTAARQGG